MSASSTAQAAATSRRPDSLLEPLAQRTQLLAAHLGETHVAQAVRLVDLRRQQQRSAAGPRTGEPDQPVAVAVERRHQALEIGTCDRHVNGLRLLRRHRHAALLEPEERAPQRLAQRPRRVPARPPCQGARRRGAPDLAECLDDCRGVRSVEHGVERRLRQVGRGGDVARESEPMQRGERGVAPRTHGADS